MRLNRKLIVAVPIFFLATVISHAQNNSVSIGTTSTNSSAVLWLESPNGNQGFIIPVGDRTKVSSTAKGMLIYDLNANQIYFHDGTIWNAVSGGTSNSKTYSLSVNATNQLVLSDGTTSTTTTVPIAGDVTGASLGNTTVARILGKPINISSFPTVGTQSLVYDGASGNWILQAGSSNSLSLTTTGNNGAANLSGNVLNVPNYTLAGLGGISLSSVSSTAPLSYNNITGVFSIPPATNLADGYLTKADWQTFNTKQGVITLTTTGTNGAATLVGNTLNIPQYTGGTAYLAGTGLTLAGSTFSVNTSQNISSLSNLTSNGLIKTTGGTGTLSIAAAGTDYENPLIFSAGFTRTTNTITVNTTQNINTLSNLTTKGVVTTTAAGLLSSSQGTGFLKDNGAGTISYDNSTYLTANQSITLSGDVTGTGTTAITTTIGAGKVTNTMLAGSIAASKLVGVDIAAVGTITAGTWNGTKISEAFGGTNQTTYAIGDILYASASNTLSKLGIGTANQVLTVSAGVPKWTAAPSPFSTNNFVPKGNGTTLVSSSIYDDGSGHVGVGTTSPGAGLEVSAPAPWESAIGITNTGGGTNWRISSNTDASLSFVRIPGSTLSAMSLTTNGGVGFAGNYGIAGQVLTSNGAAASPTWTTLSGSGTVTSVSGTLPISVANGSLAPIISIAQANGTTNGYLASADWTTFNSKQSTISLTTTGSNGAATFASNTLNIPNYTLAGLGGISLTALSATAPLTYNNVTGGFSISNAAADGLTKGAASFATNDFDATTGNISIDYTNGQAASAATKGFLSSADWTTFNNKQSTVSLTTTGTSGASTLAGNTLNVPNYTLAGLGGISLTALSATAPLTYNNVTGGFSISNAAADGLTKGAASFATNDFDATTGNITLDYTNGQAASTSTKGFLTSADWNTFNGKQGALTLTTTGTSGAATLVGNTLNVPQYAGTTYSAGTGLTLAANTFSVNTSQNISTLSNLTSNGLIKTSGGVGTLSIATAGTDYLVTETDPTVKAISGIVKSNGTTISAAVAGTDYENPLTFSTGLTRSTNTITVNTTQNIATLSNLITKGLVTTTAAGVLGSTQGTGFLKDNGTGTLSYDNSTYLTANQSITLSGDVTGTGTTAITTAIGAGKVTNTMLAGSIASTKLIGTDIATVGTITAGVWNGTKISEAFGGTNQTTYTTGDILYASASNTLSKLGIGTANQVLTVTGGVPVWAAAQSPFSTNNVVPRGNGTTLVASTIQDDGTTAAVGVAPVATNRLTVTNSTTGILQGIYATNSQAGAGSSIAVRGDASGSTNTNFGLYGTASGAGLGATGVFGSATGTSTSNYGVYGTASGGTNNYAGYFAGNTAITGALMVGGTPSAGTSGQVLTSAGAGLPPTWSPVGSSAGWAVLGNSGTTVGTNFIGNTDNVALMFKVNGLQAGLIDNSTGSNTFFGYESGKTNSGSNNNTFFGYQSGRLTASGSNNSAFGRTALLTNAVGADNTALGYNSMFNSTSSSGNTAVGRGSLFSLTFANSGTAYVTYSTGVGYEALYNTNPTAISESKFNAALGYHAGYKNITGSNNTFLGSQADGTVAGDLTNATAIGANALVNNPNSMVFGDGNVKGWGFGIDATPGSDAIRVGSTTSNGNGARLTLTGTWTNASDSTKKYNFSPLKYGLSEVMKLKPVNYIWKGTSQRDFGFLAQEVKMILPEIVYGEQGQMTLAYGQLTAVLTKAVQEQQKMIDTLQNKVNDREKKIAELEASLKSLKSEKASIEQLSAEIEKIKKALNLETTAKKE